MWHLQLASRRETVTLDYIAVIRKLQRLRKRDESVRFEMRNDAYACMYTYNYWMVF